MAKGNKLNWLPIDTYFEEKAKKLVKGNKWDEVYIVKTPHEKFVKAFYASVFTNLIKDIFPAKYVRMHGCEVCEKQATERCHGIGDERPELIYRALAKVYPDITVPTSFGDIVVEFVRQHIGTGFGFLCRECHKKETSANNRRLRLNSRSHG